MGTNHSLRITGLILTCIGFGHLVTVAGHAQDPSTFPTINDLQAGADQPSRVASPRTAQPLSTTFHCIQETNQLATVAKRGDRTTPPMILWKDTSFGPDYTPERRCQIVSDRLTQAVIDNGGKLSNLQLSYGPLNGYPVVCYVRSREETCDSGNLLLTLRQDDRGKERQLLAQILNFSVQGTGASITRGGPAIEPIAFGSQVERSLNPSLAPGTIPSHSAPLGTFREEVERSFGSSANPRVLPVQNATPTSPTRPANSGKI